MSKYNLFGVKIDFDKCDKYHGDILKVFSEAEEYIEVKHAAVALAFALSSVIRNNAEIKGISKASRLYNCVAKIIHKNVLSKIEELGGDVETVAEISTTTVDKNE